MKLRRDSHGDVITTADNTHTRPILVRSDVFDDALDYVVGILDALYFDSFLGSPSFEEATKLAKEKMVAKVDSEASAHRRHIKLLDDFKDERALAETGAAGLDTVSAHSLEELLDLPEALSYYKRYLRGEFSEENLTFWLDVREFKWVCQIKSRPA